MPVIKSAIKKLRHDKVKEKDNTLFRNAMERAVKTAQKTKSPKAMSEAFSLVDKAVKKHLIHKNKAGRIKSMLSRPEKKVAPETAAVKATPKASVKTPSKASAKAKKKTSSKTSKKAPAKK